MEEATLGEGKDYKCVTRKTFGLFQHVLAHWNLQHE